jgi:hypothetical protein
MNANNLCFLFFGGAAIAMRMLSKNRPPTPFSLGTVHHAAPPKNKKKRYVLRLTYKQATPLGFAGCKKRQLCRSTGLAIEVAGRPGDVPRAFMIEASG